MALYDLDRIEFAYGPKAVIADLSLTIEGGHFYGIIGPNGSGKSTLIDLLAGHLKDRHRSTSGSTGAPLPFTRAKTWPAESHWFLRIFASIFPTPAGKSS